MSVLLSEYTVRDWGERYSNWGRFGADDRLGTLNFITPELVRGASLLPRTGRTISCALDADESEFAVEAPDLLPASSWHTLSGSFYDGMSYNGWSIARDDTARPDWSSDATRLPVVGRGVLLDLPRFRRRHWLDGGERIGPAELDRCAEASGVSIERGDIVLLRTGSLRRCRENHSWRDLRSGPVPGLSVRCAHWIFEREIAAIAIDAHDIEVRPPETSCQSPLHMIAVRNSGLLVGTMFELDPLADACAADHNYAFLFVAPAVPQAGADRALVHPVAIK